MNSLEYRQQLLENDMRQLGESLLQLSEHIILIKDFIKLHFGDTFKAFCSERKQLTSLKTEILTESDGQQHAHHAVTAHHNHAGSSSAVIDPQTEAASWTITSDGVVLTPFEPKGSHHILHQDGDDVITSYQLKEPVVHPSLVEVDGIVFQVSSGAHDQFQVEAANEVEIMTEPSQHILTANQELAHAQAQAHAQAHVQAQAHVGHAHVQPQTITSPQVMLTEAPVDATTTSASSTPVPTTTPVKKKRPSKPSSSNFKSVKKKKSYPDSATATTTGSIRTSDNLASSASKQQSNAVSSASSSSSVISSVKDSPSKAISNSNAISNSPASTALNSSNSNSNSSSSYLLSSCLDLEQQNPNTPWSKSKCPKCSKFISDKLIREHIKSHEGIKSVCPMCDKQFSYKTSLQLHILRVHEKSRHNKTCKFCDKRFYRNRDLASHEKKHLDRKPIVEDHSSASSIVSTPSSGSKSKPALKKRPVNKNNNNPPKKSPSKPTVVNKLPNPSPNLLNQQKTTVNTVMSSPSVEEMDIKPEIGSILEPIKSERSASTTITTSTPASSTVTSTSAATPTSSSSSSSKSQEKSKPPTLTQPTAIRHSPSVGNTSTKQQSSVTTSASSSKPARSSIARIKLDPDGAGPSERNPITRLHNEVRQNCQNSASSSSSSSSGANVSG